MTDSVRESAQEPQAPRRNVAAKTSLATDLSLIAVFAGFIAALAIMPAVSLGGVAVPFTFQTLGIYITAQVLGGQACHRLRGAVPAGWFRWPAHLR